MRDEARFGERQWMSDRRKPARDSYAWRERGETHLVIVFRVCVLAVDYVRDAVLFRKGDAQREREGESSGREDERVCM